MTKFEEEFNYLIELSGKVLIGQVDTEAFEKNRIAFFEKYETEQQQALPVVPECVGIAIKQLKNDQLSLYGALNAILSDTTTEIYAWISKGNQNAFARAWLDGYTVEKPQLFYLKNKLTTSYLALDINTGYYEHWGEEIIPKLLNKQGYKTSFTKQEIDSMQTGSYEQIEVVE